MIRAHDWLTAGSAGRWVLIGLLALACGGLAGCAREPMTHPVSGRIVFEKGNLKDWVGEAVEFQSTSEPDTRAFGKINEDGTFTLSTWQEGDALNGAVTGTLRGRLIMDIMDIEDEKEGEGDKDVKAVKAENGEKGMKKAKSVKGVPAKYANFDTSGWEITVPVTGELVLTVQ